jgi:glycosyltransferase involved in cell wall biosynthesis
MGHKTSRLKVTVIIPSFERYECVCRAAASAKAQSVSTEVIVINDGSKDSRYHSKGVPRADKVIHISNTKDRLGVACIGAVRNVGIRVATGHFIAFLDDDDFWISTDKLKKQIKAMGKTYDMCCSDAFIGSGAYHPTVTKRYATMNGQVHKVMLQKKMGFIGNWPQVWNSEFLEKHNSVICSSMLIRKSLMDVVGSMECEKSFHDYPDDYEYWKLCLCHSNIVYVDEPLVYYNIGEAKQY